MVAFDIDRVRAGVAGTAFSTVTFVEATASTNDDASALLGAAGSAGTSIVADYQSAGKGRRGRAWIAPRGSALLFTTILPQIRSDALWAVPFWAALRVTEAIAATTGVIPILQWPNDLLLNEHKLCGVLSISRVNGERADVACGIGLNVHRPDDLRELREVMPPPAFVSDEYPNIDRETLLIAILNRFSLKAGDFNWPRQIANRWEKLAGFPGAPYRLVGDGDAMPVDCEALRIGENGALVTRVDGYERIFHSADASALRPHGD